MAEGLLTEADTPPRPTSPVADGLPIEANPTHPDGRCSYPMAACNESNTKVKTGRILLPNYTVYLLEAT